jgi:hypothetical protein
VADRVLNAILQNRRQYQTVIGETSS